MWQARTTSKSFYPWTARYHTWLFMDLTPKGAVFSFLFCLTIHWSDSKEPYQVRLQVYNATD